MAAPRTTGAKTSAALLESAADWSDVRVWIRMLETYRPLVRAWCLPLVGGDREAADEVAQRVWIELAGRLRGFHYEPGRSFRAWLFTIVRSRALDYRRQQGRATWGLLDGEDVAIDAPADPLDADDPRAGARAALFGLALEVEAAVRARVDEATWRAFRLRVLDGLSLAETARIVGKSVTATANAVYRVDRRLKEEGRRRLAEVRP